MQFSDFFYAGNGLLDSMKMVFFRMLPRRAQIEKVRQEINGGLLKKYGKVSQLEIDREKKAISAELDLKGEKERVRITLSNYRLSQADGGNPVFEPGTIQVSREWLDALLQTLLETNAIPAKIELKNSLHQLVLKSIL